MPSLKFIFLLIVLSFGAEATYVPERDRLIWENKLLKSELQLASNSQIYAIFDLREKKIQINARGTVLKELSIEYFKLWGASIRPEPITVVGKSSFFKPKRTKIKPKKNDEEIPSELHALEIDDMPVRYRLNFGDCIWLYIRPKPDGIISGLFNIFSYPKSFITRPMITLWNTLRQKTFTEIDIYLSEKESKFVFWALSEGLQCIIYNPCPLKDRKLGA